MRLGLFQGTLAVALLVQFGLSAQAEQGSKKAGLPDPLTLEYALSLADEMHPDLAVYHADVLAAQAEYRRIDATTDTNAYIEGRLQYVDPPDLSPIQTHDDNRLGLIIRKELYDFGRSNYQSSAAQTEVTGRQMLYLNARSQRRLQIMRRFFDVLLADLNYLRYNEDMAVAYVELDKRRDRKELGQMSDYEVLEQETHYQRMRYMRYESINQQRQTRARLAEVLNRPGQLPANLVAPGLEMLKREIPEYETLLAAAMENNYQLKALRAQLEASQQRIEAARSTNNARVYGNLEAYEYSTERTGSSDKFRAGVTVEIPVFTGDREDAEVAKATAENFRLRAQLTRLESDLRQTVLETWLQLDALRIQRDEMQALEAYRELNLDRSRALYEMEVKADLGDAMVQLTEAQYLRLQTDYKMALTWMEMDILTGKLELEQNGAEQHETQSTSSNGQQSEQIQQ